MEELKELLVDELQDLLHAETQIVQALPAMIEAAHNPKLREILEKHLVQTEAQVERLNMAFEALGEKPQAKPCKGMAGIIAEGEETIEDLKEKDERAADLGLIAAAQKVEHYEISAYGTARCLARQIGQREVSKLLSQTLGEEESSDFLLTEVSKPLLQLASNCAEGDTPWGEPGDTRPEAQRVHGKSQAAAAGVASFKSKKSGKE
ncbi:MAG TPA: ferritin-like domain-containing protein [Candidatus Acidoferrales bacterium]